MNINSYYCNHFTVFSSYRYFYPSKAIINYKQFGVGVGLGVGLGVGIGLGVGVGVGLGVGLTFSYLSKRDFSLIF